MEEEKRLFTITMDIEAEEVESMQDVYNKFFNNKYIIKTHLKTHPVEKD